MLELILRRVKESFDLEGESGCNEAADEVFKE